MRAEKWVQDIIRSYGSMTSEYDLKKGYRKICEPNPGEIVFFKNDQGLFNKVRIRSGQYFDSKYGRLSNFWRWTTIDDNGVESKEVFQGYGCFFTLG